MPRSGPNGTYTLPGAQATQVAGTPIPSAVNNQGWSDAEQTFNTIQPVAYGGNGVGDGKPLDNSFGVKNSSDLTKIGVFSAAGIPTATTRTYALPATSGTLALTSDVAGVASLVETLPSYIVDGSMTMSQENGNTLGTTNGYFPADQWAMYFTAATAAMSIQRIQARTLANAVNQLEYKCTTAKASLGASDNVLISQPIEGAWFQEAGFGTASAQRLVMRFQVSLPAGLYHWHFANSAGNRHCSVPFTIAGGEANTAVVKEIVVPPDTSGTWLTAEGVIGIVADLVLAAGATVTGGTASTWGGTTYYAASTQFNILSSTSNVARLADVGLKLDPDATGVYGQYEVGEEHPKFRSERYIWSLALSPIGISRSSSVTYSLGASFSPVLGAKTWTLLSGSFVPFGGSAGTVSLLNPTDKSTGFQNSANNWTADTQIRVTALMSARLS